MRALANACNFQESKGGVRKKNGEPDTIKAESKRKTNTKDGWKEEGKKAIRRERNRRRWNE
jgi:hypothetical protein